MSVEDNIKKMLETVAGALRDDQVAKGSTAMNARDWMRTALGTDSWSRMERTLPGAMSKVIDQLLYDWCDEGEQPHRGKILKLSNADKMYVGFNDKEWPKWEGRVEASYIDIRKTLRELQYLLEAYAFKEINGGR